MVARTFKIPYSKPSYAEYFVSIDLSNWLGASDTLSAVNFSAKDITDGTDSTAVLDAGKCTNTNTIAKPFIKGGEHGHKYRVTMQVITIEEAKEEFYLEFECENKT